MSETAAPGGEWLTTPLVRRDGELVPTTWDIALSRVGQQFSNALEQSRNAIAVLGSGQQTTEATYALGKLARGGFGTRYYDANTTLCMASAVTAYYRAFGSDAPPPTYDDIPAAESHIVWGANPAVAHPVLFRWLRQSAQQSDSRLLVVDPVQTKTAAEGDTHIQLDPGGDLALARAVLTRLVETDRIDEQFIDNATVGFDALVDSLPSVETAASTTGVGVDVELIEQLAAAFEHPTLVYWGMGVNQSVRGTQTAQALIDLCLATGNLEPGSGPFSLTGQANSMGTRVCSSKGTWPGHRSFDDPEHRSVVADVWNVPVERLPTDAGPGPVGISAAIETGVEAVYCVGTNPVAGLPDATAARDRFDDVFLVVQDAFRTETTDVADVVLPAATWGESSGTVMNMERTVSRVRPATETPSGVRQDIDIIAAIAARLAPGLLPEPPIDPETVFDEFRALTAGTPADCSGIDYDRLDEEHAVRWPAPTAETSGGYRYYETNGWSFPTANGRARFSTRINEERPDPEPTDDTYPLTLTTARTADDYNTGIRSRTPLDDPDPLHARIHPDTFTTQIRRRREHDNDDGDNDGEHHRCAYIESRRASVPVRVEPDSAIQRGMVWVPIHHPLVNTLTIAATDPDSAEPNYKQCAVRLVYEPLPLARSHCSCRCTSRR